MHPVQARAERRLRELSRARRYRSLPGSCASQKDQAEGEIIDVTGNDYLGLGGDTHLQALLDRERRANPVPLGAAGSRLLGGDYPLFHEAETRFARFKRAESSLLFSSGFSANLGVTHALAELGCHIFSDAHNHASIVDGLRMAPLPRSRRHSFSHLNLTELESGLQSLPKSTLKAIYVEAVYSMDGDSPNFARLQELAQTYQALIVLDEAHSLGLYGTHGCGLSEKFYTSDQETRDSSNHRRSLQLITINPCGKAFGAQGAFVAGPVWFKEYLINRARSFMYSTALSPWVVQGLMVVTDYMASLDSRRMQLKTLCGQAVDALKQKGIPTPPTESHILPIVMPGDQNCLACERFLQNHGVFAKAIRKPTVAAGQERIRLSLHTDLNQQNVQKIADLIHAFQHEDRPMSH